MSLFDAIQLPFVKPGENVERLGILGNKTHGHMFFRPLAAAPTTSAHYEGRYWFLASKAALYFRGLVKAATYGSLFHPGCLEASLAAQDVASLADGEGATISVTVTNAELGDFAVASLGVDVQGITVTANVSAANTVAVRVQNESGGVLDLASTTVRVMVFKKTT